MVGVHVRASIRALTGRLRGRAKDLIARPLQKTQAGGFWSLPRAHSAVVETLFESELFGHVRGSPTGATNDKPGDLRPRRGPGVFVCV